MKKSTLLLLLTVLNFCFAFGQFKPNSIGICYLQQDTADYYSLTIALPYKTLENHNLQPIQELIVVIDSFSYSGQIILFDKAGEIASIENKDKFLLEFWCENDGGIQYRPTLNTKIKKAHFAQPLKPISEIQNICCFVILNRNEQKTEFTDLKTKVDIKLIGDYDRDGKIDCLIWTVLDEAMNCADKPDNNLDIMLRVGKQDYYLRCCGP